MTRPLVQNAGDRKQVDRARSSEARDRALALNDLRLVLDGNADGSTARRVIWRILTEAGLDGPRRFVAGGATSFEYAYQLGVVDGMRRIGEIFARDAEAAAPELYDRMRAEARQRPERADDDAPATTEKNDDVDS